MKKQKNKIHENVIQNIIKQYINEKYINNTKSVNNILTEKINNVLHQELRKILFEDRTVDDNGVVTVDNFDKIKEILIKPEHEDDVWFYTKLFNVIKIIHIYILKEMLVII